MGDGGANDRRRLRRRRRQLSHSGILASSSQEELAEEEDEEEEEEEEEEDDDDDVGVEKGYEEASAQVQVQVNGSQLACEEDKYVDQNRNLNLSEISQEQKEEKQDQEITTSQEEQKRQQANVSPILSLSSSLEQSSSDCTTTCTTTTSTSSSSTSARMSQASLVNVLQQVNNGKGSQHTKHDHENEANLKDHHCDQLSSQYAGRRTRFADSHVSLDMHEQTTRIVCTNGDDDDDDDRDDVRHKLPIRMSLPYAKNIDHEEEEDDDDDDEDDDRTLDRRRTENRPNSLVRQLGRRVSLFVGRRTSRSSAGDHYQHHDLESRRFSLQQQQQSYHQDSLLMQLPVVAPSPEVAPVEPVVAVAGVGGTITTVTRSKRKTAPLPRLVAKNGQVNLFLDNIDRRQYVRDLFTTMIDIKWRYNLMAAAFGFVFSWLFFACIWYLVLYFHDDLAHENDPQWSPCIVNVYSFPAALLFSIETQSTLGFGSRIISVECPGAIVIFCSQLIFGVVVECLIVGMVFAKLSRPTKRSQTIMYSKFATVCLRESKMCLTFRVGDVRSKSHIIGATIRASLVSSKTTQEGEQIPFYHYKLNVHIDDCKQSLLLIWPVTIIHIIDEQSPFYHLNSDQLANFKFEIITVLEGTVESTGQSIQVRSSYLPSEVKWGYRFEPIVSTHGYGRYAQTIIDYNKFNRILEVPTPRCSPLDYYSRV